MKRFARSITGAMGVAVSLCALLAGGAAHGSAGGEAIGGQVDIATYQHYLEDLLYTHLGDDRGFGPEHDLARDNIQQTLESLDLTVQLEPFTYNSTTYFNVVATQLGVDEPGDVIVVGAHFDSVSNPGADDNGTGTALVMEVARVLSGHRSSKTIKYVLFDREEQGRRGSIAFVSDHAAENIVGAVTADMIGHDSGAYRMDVFGTAASSGGVNRMAAAIGTYGDGLAAQTNIGNFSFSDHWSFESAGIPAFVIIEDCYQCNANYHTPSDAVDIAPGYIDYAMVEDLLHSVIGYLVDEVGITIYGDVDGDGEVSVVDLLALLAAWGPCAACPEDTNGDGFVDVVDLLTLLANWS